MNIEKRLIEYLNTQLSVPVYGDVPEVMPDTFVTLEKTGSHRENLIETSTIAVQSWAKASREDACDLNDLVKVAMDGAVSLTEVFRSACETDYNFTDTATKRYRYQAVYAVVHH